MLVPISLRIPRKHKQIITDLVKRGYCASESEFIRDAILWVLKDMSKKDFLWNPDTQRVEHVVNAENL